MFILLINVYRSYVLSHFAYSAPALTSATSKIKEEMEVFQRRAFKAIVIKSERVEREYSIASIEQHITKHCACTLKRIISDPGTSNQQKTASYDSEARTPV